ncbi:MAG: putative metal-binding motif-containing protein [Polyangiales bacterium]
MSMLVRSWKLVALVAVGSVLAGCSALVNTDPDELGGGTTDGGVGTDGGGGCAAGCDDGIACTDDSCVGDACSATPNDALCAPGERCNPGSGCVPIRCTTDADCNDGNACNGVEVCGGAAPDAVTGCSAGGAISCDDGVPCTADRCDPDTGCVNTPVDAACDDGVGCTVDRCDAAMGCVRTPDDSLCDDGVCFEGGRCDPTRDCLGATAVDCRDGDPCTDDLCEPGVGCQNPERDDDGDGFAVEAMGRCGGDDCDDTNDAVYPGATELCNAIDDDCDGRVDEDPSCATDLPDDCGSATAITLAANAGSITGSFVGLTDDYDTLCETSTGSRSAIGGTSRGASPDAIHYVDLPAGNWDVRIEAESASVDTVLAVATTCGDFDLGGLGCNDDANLGASTNSRVWLHRVGSSFSTTRIFLLVEPYGTSASGSYTLNVRLASAAADRCGAALDIRGGGTVVGFGGVASGAAGSFRGSCQGDASFLEGEHLFFYGSASREMPAVFELYSDTHTPDLYTRFTCDDGRTEGGCDLGEDIGGGIDQARIQVNGGNTVFADGLSGSGSVYSLYYDP